jgi:diguanylate cyclase (GGDEF)-like protein
MSDPTTPGRGADRLWWWFGAGGVALLVVYRFVSEGVPRDVVYFVVGFAAVGAILVGVRRNRPSNPRPWLFLAAGQAVWVVGDCLDSWHELTGNLGYPTSADVCYLLGYPLIAAAITMIVRDRRALDDFGSTLDGLTVTAGLGLLSFVVLIRPALEGTDDSLVATLVTLAYPAFDILLLGAVIPLLSAGGKGSRSLFSLLVGAGLVLVADTATSAYDLYAGEERVWPDYVFLMSYLAFGAAALDPSARSSTDPASRQVQFGRWRLIALGVAVLIAPGTLAVQQIAGARLDVWGVVAGSAVMFLLVVWRMFVAIGQIAEVSRQRKKLQEELAYEAAHDSLTDLPNRAEAMSLIRAALSRAQRSGELVSLLFIDLDGFKLVNDTFGHPAGDELLRVVAHRLRGAVRDGDVVSRLGGDEFVVLLEPVADVAVAMAAAQRIVEVVSEPVVIGRDTARVGASIGVAVNEDSRTDAEQLIHEADVAAYRAKAGGRGRSELFDVSLRAELAATLELEAALRRAVTDDELVLHYQPIVRVADGAVEGFEALVRWQRPGVGLVMPSEFLHVAQTSDLICDIGAWVLVHAAQQVREWSARQDSTGVFVSVNVDGRHATRARIVDDVARALRVVEIRPDQLVLEVSEATLSTDLAAVEHLRAVRALGVRVSLDDFGTGYATIERLRDLPVDTAKIDGRFLDLSTPGVLALLRLMVHTAHTAGLQTVAEGVEGAEQLDALGGLDIESAQGYHVGRPLPSDEAGRLVEPRGAGRRLD